MFDELSDPPAIANDVDGGDQDFVERGVCFDAEGLLFALVGEGGDVVMMKVVVIVVVMVVVMLMLVNLKT